jgi:hypothetical protein
LKNPPDRQVTLIVKSPANITTKCNQVDHDFCQLACGGLCGGVTKFASDLRVESGFDDCNPNID